MTLKRASDRRDLGPWFTARFNSECMGGSPNCLITIEEGDPARYRDGEVVCEECGNENNDSTSRSAEVICSVCWVALPAGAVRAGRTTHEECE